MLFLPLKGDLPSPYIPFVTILIIFLCLFVFWQQEKSDEAIAQKVEQFCAWQEGRVHNIVMSKLAEGADLDVENVCGVVISAMHFSNNKEYTLREIVKYAPKFTIMSEGETRKYIEQHLQELYDEFSSSTPKTLTQRLQYSPQNYDVISMITSAFSHGSWSHVVGNLFFFFAFAATVEIILGSVFFSIIVVLLAIGTNLTYALVVSGTAESLPTIGLSGVVMGMIGMFVYFIPREKIVCFFWAIVIFKRLRVPAYVLAAWYFGWDVYDLTNQGVSTGINLVAHVSGFVLGYSFGQLLFRRRKQEVMNELKEYRGRKEMLAALK